jgi:hypothetical protein
LAQPGHGGRHVEHALGRLLPERYEIAVVGALKITPQPIEAFVQPLFARGKALAYCCDSVAVTLDPLSDRPLKRELTAVVKDL